jgi:hypothetical protein
LTPVAKASLLDQENAVLPVDSEHVKSKKAGSDVAGIFPGCYELGGQGNEITAGQILSESEPGEPVLEYSLNISSAESYDVLPLWLITPKYINGNLVGLVGSNPVNGSYMWCEEYTRVFPPFSSYEASLILKSRGYQPTSDPRLVLFNFETYWMFSTVKAQKETDAFVAWSDEKVVSKVDVLTELLLQLQNDNSGAMKGGGLCSQEHVVSGTSALTTLDKAPGNNNLTAQSYPAAHDWMVGKVPYFMQGQTKWCGIFSQKNVLWWYGAFVSEFNIASYLGKGTSDYQTLEELDRSFVHFLGRDDHSKVDHGYGSSNIDTEKSWLYGDSPTICAIHAPGSGGDSDQMNHFVTLVGWDDNLGGGSWCLHDSNPWIKRPSGVGYDVWVSYSTFESYWSAYWYYWPGGGYRHGSVSAEPQADMSRAVPTVPIVLSSTTIFDNETATLSIGLKNVGSDYSYTRQGRDNGVFIELTGAVVQSPNIFAGVGFTSYATFDDNGNEAPLGSTTRIIEFYADWAIPPNAGPYWARITIKPTTVGTVTIRYRGWMTDEDEMVRQNNVTINDSRPGTRFTFPVAEYFISRYPVDSVNRRTNILDYPAYRAYIAVNDDDTQGPVIVGPITTGNIFANYTSDYIVGAKTELGCHVEVTYWYTGARATPAITVNTTRTRIRIYPFPCDYWFTIPRSEWIQHAPCDIYMRIRAGDGDNDRPGDSAYTQSGVYHVGSVTGKTPSVTIFTDGFGSGSFSAWTGTDGTSGETETVVNTMAHHAPYSAKFTSNGNLGTESAFCYKTITPSAELYARGYFRVTTSGIATNWDSFYLMMFRAGESALFNPVAWAGWIMMDGVVRWHLLIRDGTGFVWTEALSTASPALNQWYCVELHWWKHSTQGMAELYVNGRLACSITGKDTTAFGNVERLDFGLPELVNLPPSTTAYCDCVKVARTYVGPEFIVGDSFESGSFSAWTGKSVSVGETATVVSTMAHHGTYSAKFTSNGNGGFESASCYKNISPLAEVYVRGYFRVATSGIVDNGDRISFIALANASGYTAAYAGWYKTGGVVKWYLVLGSLIVYSTTSPSLNTWYCVELHWKKGTTTGLGELYVNGVKVCSLTGKNTATYGSISQVIFGLALRNCASATAYCDCTKIATTYIGREY